MRAVEILQERLGNALDFMHAKRTAAFWRAKGAEAAFCRSAARPCAPSTDTCGSARRIVTRCHRGSGSANAMTW